ncbi:MAG: choice-of-anchor I family protein, partial [Flavobacteriales bacterium]
MKHNRALYFKVLLLWSCFSGFFNAASQPLELSFLGRYSTGTYDAGGAEISAFDPASKRVFSVNGATGKLDIINISNPAGPALVTSVDLSSFGAAANSVAAKNGIIAIAVEATVKQDPGKVVFIDANGAVLNSVTVGALPDMICFSPNGQYVLTANEGEPNNAYTVDPEGSVSIINISGGVNSATVATAGFTSFNGTTLPYGIRIYGPNASVAQDLEPEFITVSPNSQTAWVTCQENNCWAIIDIPTATVTSLVPMGFKNHNISGNGLDASDQNSGVVNITQWPIRGMYQPDGIANFVVNGQTYLISANEGDARAYTGFNEEARVSSSSYVLDPAKFPNAST